MSCPTCGAATAIADPQCRQCGADLNRPYAVSPAALEQSTPGSAPRSPYGGFWRRAPGAVTARFIRWLSGRDCWAGPPRDECRRVRGR